MGMARAVVAILKVGSAFLSSIRMLGSVASNEGSLLLLSTA